MPPAGEVRLGEPVIRHVSHLVGKAVTEIVRDAAPGETYQFLRTGYFCKDPDSTPELPVFNRTVGLRDTFAKQAKKA